MRGPRVAVFHDAIGLKLPELTPPGTVARLPAYLRELLLFDGIAAVSEDSATSPARLLAVARRHRRTARASHPARARSGFVFIGWTAGIPAQCRGCSPSAQLKAVKIISHLLEACEALWSEGLSFELQLLGLARADTAGRALAKIAALRQAGRPRALSWRGPQRGIAHGLPAVCLHGLSVFP